MKPCAPTGLRRNPDFLNGRIRFKSDVEYIGEVIKLAAKHFSTVGIEIYPVNTDEYAYLHECGADFVAVYQETYNIQKYEQVHLWGSKNEAFRYRFHAQERALLGGMRGVSFGALLGLDDFRKDAFAAGLHAYYIQKKYPHAEIDFSVPLRPYMDNREKNPGACRGKRTPASHARLPAVHAVCGDNDFDERTGQIPRSRHRTGGNENIGRVRSP